jgi:FKBP-type peptidyl-prolyl cis-trans isomerase 2
MYRNKLKCLLALNILLWLGLQPGGTDPMAAGDSPGFTAQDRQEVQDVLKQAYDRALRTGKSVAVEVGDPAQAVEKGDLVHVDLRIRTVDGRLYAANNQNPESTADHRSTRLLTTPDSVIAGMPNEVPAVGDLIVGMHVNDRKHITVAADQCYGRRNEALVVEYPRRHRFPKAIQMNAREFAERFNAFPIVGQEMEFDPYLNARVVAIDTDIVSLELLARSDHPVDLPYGSVIVTETDQSITIQMLPKLGADFRVNGRSGRIVDYDNDSVRIDFNHIMAGMDLVFDIKVISLIKSKQFNTLNIDWFDSYDDSIAVAAKAGKPLVLVLYASWCSWSKKFMDHTLEDPRIKVLRNKFVWARVDSYQKREYKGMYGQDGFPMIVVLSDQGNVIKKISGYKKPIEFRRDLLDALDNRS